MIHSVRSPSVLDSMTDSIRSRAKSCPCDTRVSLHVNGRVRSNERSNERSVSNGWDYTRPIAQSLRTRG